MTEDAPLLDEHRPVCWQCGQNPAAIYLELSICVVCAGIVAPPEEESG